MAPPPTPEQLQAAREKLLAGPVVKPPPGVKANLDHPANLEKLSNDVLIGLLVISTVVFTIRIYTKLRVLKKLTIDDYLLITSFMIYAFGYHTVSFLLTAIPSGTHLWDTRLGAFIRLRYLLHIANVLYGLVIVFLKAAIIVQCLTVFVPTGTRNVAFWVFQVMLLVHVIIYTIFTFVEIFACSPRAKFWDPTIKGGSCLDALAINIWAAAINTASDLVLVVVPQVVIWRLNMPLSKKLAVSSVFLIGLLACASSAVRVYWSAELMHNKDFTYVVTFLGMWTMPEMTFGFMAACLPVLPRFVRHLTSKPFFSEMGSSFRTFLRIRRSGSLRYTNTSEKSGKSGKPEAQPKMNAVITDVEFDELVKRTDNHSMNQSMVSADHTDNEDKKWKKPESWEHV